METIYINAQWPEELRIASLRDGKLYDLEIEIANNNRNKGNIYNAKIAKIESSLNAVFVDYGQSKNGFLPLKEIHKGYLPKDENGKFDISSIQLGQKILVQVEKDERGEKGAALTTYISLAGTYLVYMPYSSKSSAISKQAEHKERAELKSILDSLNIENGSGIIVRTAGIGKTKEDLSWDYNALKNHWESILASSHENSAPCLIFQEANPIIRVLRDNLKVETEKIVVDTQEAYNQIKSFIERIRPNLVDAIELNTSSLPLFAQYDIDDQIKDIYERHIQLPSGGEITIDTTEALTAIDINSAKSTKSGDIESTALHTNLEAVMAIAHQLKIRDIGGIVVIDFIDMIDKKNRAAIEEKAKELFVHDRAKIKFDSISNLTGCMCLLRQKLNSFANNTMTFESVCNIENLAYHLLRKCQSIAAEAQVKIVQLQVSVDMGTFMLNESRAIIERISKDSNAIIQIIPNPNYERNKYNIKSIRGMQKKPSPSFTLKENLETPLPDNIGKKSQMEKSAAVHQQIYKQPAPSNKGIVFRLFCFFNLFKSINKPKSTSKKQPETTQRVGPKKQYKKNHHRNSSIRRKRNPVNRKRPQNHDDQ